jgi:hypothetical protein
VCVICWLLVEKAWRLILRVSVCPLYSWFFWYLNFSLWSW